MTGRSKNHVIAAVYGSNMDAVAAITEVQRSPFDMRNLSIVGRDRRTEGHSIGYCNAGGRMKYWGEDDAFWDDLWGMLHGSAFCFIPGFGSLLVGGPIFSSILGALEGSLPTGLSNAVGAGIHSMGVPGDKVEPYETALRHGRYLVIAEVVSSDTSNAREIIAATAPLFWRDYPTELLRETASC